MLSLVYSSLGEIEKQIVIYITNHIDLSVLIVTNIKNDESEERLLDSKENGPFPQEKTETECLRMRRIVIMSTIHICGYTSVDSTDQNIGQNMEKQMLCCC